MILQALNEHQKHPQALEIRERLETVANTQTLEIKNLTKLYRVFKGPAAVESLLRQVLAIQDARDAEKAREFVERWTNWDQDLHEVIAAKIRGALGRGARRYPQH